MTGTKQDIPLQISKMNIVLAALSVISLHSYEGSGGLTCSVNMSYRTLFNVTFSQFNIVHHKQYDIHSYYRVASVGNKLIIIYA